MNHYDNPHPKFIIVFMQRIAYMHTQAGKALKHENSISEIERNKITMYHPLNATIESNHLKKSNI